MSILSTALKGTAAAVALAMAGTVPALANDHDTIRIGYAISKTGPYAGGASVTTLPNYELWVNQVNEAGGIELADGTRAKIEVIEYDDRSNSEEAVRAIERLINQDEVDFVLPPWGTALNLATGPIFDRHGYPQLSVTSVSDRIPQLIERWPNAFFFSSTSEAYATGIVDVLAALREAGEIEGRVAMVNVADQFGIELANAARKGLEAANFDIVYRQSYPPGSQDMQTIINEIRRLEPEAFLAFSYPPDTIALTDLSIQLGLNTPVFYTAVGTAFPLFKGRFGDNVEGVMGTGGVNVNTEAMQEYIAAHQALTGNEPDRWLSAVTYASLQVLQQAIEKVGKVDREAVAKAMAEGTYDTVVGPMNLADRHYTQGWLVGQWQDGEFNAVGPDRDGAVDVEFPKPNWQ